MNTIKLQSIGETPAIEAANLQEGDLTIWNFGAQSEVVGFNEEKETKCFVVVVLKNEDGETYERRMKKDRLVGFFRPETKKPRVTYRQVKKALRAGWVSPLNSREGAFELPSYSVKTVTPTPEKQVFSIVAFEGGRWVPARAENASGFSSMKEAYKRSFDFHQMTKVLAHNDNDASFYEALRELNG